MRWPESCRIVWLPLIMMLVARHAMWLLLLLSGVSPMVLLLLLLLLLGWLLPGSVIMSLAGGMMHWRVQYVLLWLL